MKLKDILHENMVLEAYPREVWNGVREMARVYANSNKFSTIEAANEHFITRCNIIFKDEWNTIRNPVNPRGSKAQFKIDDPTAYRGAIDYK